MKLKLERPYGVAEKDMVKLSNAGGVSSCLLLVLPVRETEKKPVDK